MPVPHDATDDGTPGPAPDRPSLWAGGLAALAGAAQALVLLATLLLGQGWGGWTYGVAVLQALVAFVPLTRLQARPLVLLVPVVSAALTAGLLAVGAAQAHGTA